MRFHWQNLNDRNIEGKTGRGFWHGRAWLNLFDEIRQAANIVMSSDHGSVAVPVGARLSSADGSTYEVQSPTPIRAAIARVLDRYIAPVTVRAEWSHGRLGLALELSFDRDEHEVTVHLAGPGFSYWLALEGVPRALIRMLPFAFNRTEHSYMGSERSIGFRTHNGAIWFSLWEDRMEWRSSDPWWMRGRVGLDDLADLLFGKTQYSRRSVSTQAVQIPMPEKTYPATVTIEAASWIRPRWPWPPFSRFRISSDIKIPDGIPVPGKGENSYDIDDDAVYGFSSPAKTVETAIGNVISSVLGTRARRIGRHTMRGQEASRG